MPAPETVALLSEAVTRLIDAGAQVVLSSGNHDSAIRLGFASDLLERAGLHIRTRLDGIGSPGAGRRHRGLPPALPRAVDRRRPARRRRAHPRRRAAGRDGAGPRRPRRAAGPGLGRHGPRVRHRRRHQRVRARHQRRRRQRRATPTSSTASTTPRWATCTAARQISETVRYSGSPVALSFSEAAPHQGLLAGGPVRGPRRVARRRRRRCVRPVRRAARHARGAARRPAPTRARSRPGARSPSPTPVRPLGAMERVRQRFPHTLVLQFEDAGVQVGATLLRRAGPRARRPRRVLRLPRARARRAPAPPSRSGPCWPRRSRASRHGRAVREDEGQADTARFPAAARRSVA